jgi:hypothetical protein
MGGGVEGLFFYFGEQVGGRYGRTAGEGRGLIVETGQGTGWEAAEWAAAGGLIWKNKAFEEQELDARRGLGAGGIDIHFPLPGALQVRSGRGAGRRVVLFPLPGKEWAVRVIRGGPLLECRRWSPIHLPKTLCRKWSFTMRRRTGRRVVLLH